ncbi:heme A synthase [Caulobacter sp. SLTY]|uniref:COX15/CtaA family protein n=1 Tax=Caulobacter sp. SLTY TaxID=2683262 RepID=UPI001412EF25|nr:COX15/CtaA family protein [Caulobacter sp. SLTY]NBB15811.1 heme A synthase [Caulobacter sp. SLTY]
MTSFLRSDRSTPVAIWLAIVAVLILAMVVVGGATRLTGSGLSITEWQPIMGALPPMGDAAWAEAFAKYREIPQYKLVNAGMTMDEFKFIFWWEWGHRLLGRLIGLVFAVPFVVFLVSRQIPKRLVWRCVGLLVLGGMQGVIGWWMVASGLSERVSVAPERLTVHLGMALALFVMTVWTALEAWAGKPRQPSDTPWRTWALVFLGAVFFQCLLGALVAGTDAGFAYNDWPLMAGQVFPRDYAGDGLWQTLAHNQASVQFHHRVGGYLLALATAVLAAFAYRDRVLPREAKQAAWILTGVVVLQILLGIAALMLVVPLWLGLLHQAGAVFLLAAATLFAWRVRRS